MRSARCAISSTSTRAAGWGGDLKVRGPESSFCRCVQCVNKEQLYLLRSYVSRLRSSPPDSCMRRSLLLPKTTLIHSHKLPAASRPGDKLHRMIYDTTGQKFQNKIPADYYILEEYSDGQTPNVLVFAISTTIFCFCCHTDCQPFLELVLSLLPLLLYPFEMC